MLLNYNSHYIQIISKGRDYMKKELSLVITIVLFASLFSACAKSDKTVSVYFKDATENKLNEEKRAIPEKDKKDAKAIAKFALSQMITGPQSEGNKALFPEDTKLLSIAINGGVATLDFSKPCCPPTIMIFGMPFCASEILTGLKSYI